MAAKDRTIGVSHFDTHQQDVTGSLRERPPAVHVDQCLTPGRRQLWTLLLNRNVQTPTDLASGPEDTVYGAYQCSCGVEGGSIRPTGRSGNNQFGLFSTITTHTGAHADTDTNSHF